MKVFGFILLMVIISSFMFINQLNVVSPKHIYGEIPARSPHRNATTYVFASLQRKQFDVAQDVSRELMNIGGISGLSGPVGNVASLFHRMHDLLPNAATFMNVSSNHIYGEIPASLPPSATFIDCSQVNGLTDGRHRDHLLHVKQQLASKSTASMHVDPLILVLCFLLCFLVLKQQQQQQQQPQPQPPEEVKLPAQLSQHDLDHQDEEDHEDEEDQEVEEELEPFYPNAEEEFFWKDDRALWKRERGGRRHWKKRFNSHH